MAGDTRDSSQLTPPPGSIADVENAPPSKNYESFTNPPPNANSLPAGSGQNTAGSRKAPPKFSEAMRTVRLEDFKQVHKYPCVRESLLVGIGAGFGIGGLRALLRAPIPVAANWAVGSFVFVAFGNYEYCHFKRHTEKSNMKRAVEVMDRKKLEREAQAKVKREEDRRRAKEEADKQAEEARKRSWKFW